MNIKQHLKYITTATITLALPLLVSAQGTVIAENGGDFGTLLTNIIDFANLVLIPFILGIGFLVFVFGMFRFFIYGGADEEAKKQGKSLMVYATLGFVIIIIFWGVVSLLASSTGLDNEGLRTVPAAQGIRA